jgi:ectoine hydroxylase-related dioxygenase (phytanoyl-CoA dioxygenase family)
MQAFTSQSDLPKAQQASAITREHVARFERDGHVLLENALPVDFVATVRESFMKAMDAKVARFALAPVKPTDGRDKGNDKVKIDFRPEGGNHDLNRWNMHLPTHEEFLHELLIANPVALPVIKALLGPAPVAFLIASDTPYPGSGFQNIHQDFPRFGLTVNVPLVDFTEDNAPLEIWPGSHVREGDKFHTGKADLSEEEIKALVLRIPGKRMLIKAGSILIRDQRMVHRGTANTGTEPRPCLAIWYKNLDHFRLTSLTIPVPHRSVGNRLARVALKMRQQGRGDAGAVANRKLLNLANFFGRVVEETSASDRDYRRQIPHEMWRRFSPEMKSLLRYASIEGETGGARSLLGSAILLTAGAAFALRGWQLKRTGSSISRNSDRAA